MQSYLQTIEFGETSEFSEIHDFNSLLGHAVPAQEQNKQRSCTTINKTDTYKTDTRSQSDPHQLIDSIQTRVEKMAAYFGRRCNVDEDDLRQEAWVAVLEMLPRLDYTVGTPEQHLLKRARWRILDSIRRQLRRQHIGLEDVPTTMASYLDARNGIDMGALFARLTTTQQRILRALMEGYTWREVGSIVGCTSANVAYHVRRIRAVYSELNGDEEA